MNTRRSIKYVKSCGFVAYKQIESRNYYLIIKSLNGDIGFPKGHMEENESETQTALREVKEEVGLTVALSTKFRSEDAHTFIRNGEERLKHIVYFLGEYSAQTPNAQQTELSGVYLMNYETAMSAFQFESSKRLLTDAHNFLMQQ
jgi:8-oxo-dGTP pyrophosphatase MutT (NUDIX family)